MKNFVTIGLSLLVALLIGFFWGKSSVKTPDPIKVVEVRYEKGDTIHDTINQPIPYEVKIPVDVPVFIPTDTAALFAVWQDYYLERKYDLDFSNDSLGTFKVDAVVNQNKIVNATSIIQPNIKIITEKEVVYQEPKVPLLRPFILLGSSLDAKVIKVQGGMDIKNKYMLGVSGMKVDDSYNYTINLGIKF